MPVISWSRTLVDFGDITFLGRSSPRRSKARFCESGNCVYELLPLEIYLHVLELAFLQPHILEHLGRGQLLPSGFADRRRPS